MKIQSFKKLKDNKYKVLLDNDEELVLYDDVIVKYNLLVNKDLDKNNLQEIIKYNSRMEAYYLALKALNKKMRTKKELYIMLKKQEFEDSVINEVINKLVEENYLNEQKYINAYINDQINLKDIGPNKIKYNLVELGFNDDDINKYLDAIEYIIWENKINKYISKKIKSNSNLSANKLKQKITIDLVTKGFSKEDVVKIIDSYEFKNDDNLILKDYNKIKKKLEVKYNGNELVYQIKNKLYTKGYSYEEIERIIKGDKYVY